MGAIEQLNRTDRRLALLAALAKSGIKPVSRLDGYEGPEKIVQNLLHKAGLEAEVSQAGCRSDVLFGTTDGLKAYKKAQRKRDKEKIVATGLAFGYPECCAKFFARLMAGETDEKPDKRPPTEHFWCPGCEESPKLHEEYLRVQNDLQG